MKGEDILDEAMPPNEVAIIIVIRTDEGPCAIQG